MVHKASEPIVLTLSFLPTEETTIVFWAADVIGTRRSSLNAPYADANLALILRALDVLQYPNYPVPQTPAQQRFFSFNTIVPSPANAQETAAPRAGASQSIVARKRSSVRDVTMTGSTGADQRAIAEDQSTIESVELHADGSAHQEVRAEEESEVREARLDDLNEQPGAGESGEQKCVPVPSRAASPRPKWACFGSLLLNSSGNGYATEAAQAMIQHAFTDLRLKRVIATTEYTNTASQGVMRKLGMQVLRNPLSEPHCLQIVGVLQNPG